MKQQEEMFFFEEKNQQTFVCLVPRKPKEVHVW
jgi:hypothetical protein